MRARVFTRDDFAKPLLRAATARQSWFQVADVTIGQAVCFGCGSEGGNEVVIGTAVMRVGENTRRVAAAVDVRFERNHPPIAARCRLHGQVQAMLATVPETENFDAARWLGRWLSGPLPALAVFACYPGGMRVNYIRRAC